MAEVEVYGIRHHGPGSARRLREAFAAAPPSDVLIEGPADLSQLLPMLAAPGMEPPVALLAYPVDDPARAVFWPFAAYSPEYQAVIWAVEQGVPVRFIDLPVSWRMEDTLDPEPLVGDPIGQLAKAAGYEDGESWWRDVIEENPEPGPIFAAVSDAMAALREGTDLPRFEAMREAHMRLEIAKAAKAAEGTVAVVCGAWHAPALKAKRFAKDDRALLKGATKRKIAATWAPWTTPRLATRSGYGAGVTAPAWCQHLWDAADQPTVRWVAKIGAALRVQGQTVSTASLIEAVRLAGTLAAIRDRPAPGFEEMREAAIACLAHGNPFVWQTISEELLIGHGVGSIPEDVPLAPLLEDLKRQQRSARLKPEALDRELGLDLRSDSGLFRSTLLHRLALLGVGWGVLADPGGSRGTFRERWRLRWEPEHAVQLVENLVYGATIEAAAIAKIAEKMAQAADLQTLADLVFAAMTAQLPKAAEDGIRFLGMRAAQTSDATEMLSALPPLADVLRYGKARATDTEQLGALFERIAAQGALALPYAVRDLDDDAMAALRGILGRADDALRLVGTEALSGWRNALQAIIGDARANRVLAGLAARLLYLSGDLTAEPAVALFGRALSPGTPVPDAANFFAGFFEGIGSRLVYDADLRSCVDAWLCSLEPETFTEHLPLLRRVFADLDASERRRMLTALTGRAETGGRMLAPGAEARWPEHLASVAKILKGDLT